MGKPLPGKCEDLSLDPQHPHTCQVGVVTCVPSTWKTASRNLPESTHQALGSNKKPCLKVWCGERYLMSVWCTPHTHVPTHVHANIQKQGEGEEAPPPVRKVHSTHPLTSHSLETECGYHTTLRSKTDRNLAPPPKWNPNPESTMWRGVSQSLEDKYCMFLLHAEPPLQHQEHHPWCYVDQINQTWSILQTVLLVFIPVEFIPTCNFTRCMLMEMSNVLHSFWNVRGFLNQIKTWGNWHTHVRHLPGMVIITSPTKQNYLISSRRWGCF